MMISTVHKIFHDLNIVQIVLEGYKQNPYNYTDSLNQPADLPQDIHLRVRNPIILRVLLRKHKVEVINHPLRFPDLIALGELDITLLHIHVLMLLIFIDDPKDAILQYHFVS